MKDSHIYQRMSNPIVMKTYLNMIRTYDMSIVEDLYKNITVNANDHPRYSVINEAYEARLNEKKE